jgi:hypothetical protein
VRYGCHVLPAGSLVTPSQPIRVLVSRRAALITVDASGSDNSVHVLVGVGVALGAAAAVALEGIVATRAMVGLDTNTVMAVRQLLSAVMFGVVLLVVPGGITRAGSVMVDTALIVPIVCGGVIGGYSYAI